MLEQIPFLYRNFKYVSTIYKKGNITSVFLHKLITVLSFTI
jgi:hypothetical protein